MLKRLENIFRHEHAKPIKLAALDTLSSLKLDLEKNRSMIQIALSDLDQDVKLAAISHTTSLGGSLSRVLLSPLMRQEQPRPIRERVLHTWEQIGDQDAFWGIAQCGYVDQDTEIVDSPFKSINVYNDLPPTPYTFNKDTDVVVNDIVTGIEILWVPCDVISGGSLRVILVNRMINLWWCCIDHSDCDIVHCPVSICIINKQHPLINSNTKPIDRLNDLTSTPSPTSPSTIASAIFCVLCHMVS